MDLSNVRIGDAKMPALIAAGTTTALTATAGLLTAGLHETVRPSSLVTTAAFGLAAGATAAAAVLEPQVFGSVDTSKASSLGAMAGEGAAALLLTSIAAHAVLTRGHMGSETFAAAPALVGLGALAGFGDIAYDKLT